MFCSLQLSTHYVLCCVLQISLLHVPPTVWTVARVEPWRGFWLNSLSLFLNVKLWWKSWRFFPKTWRMFDWIFFHHHIVGSCNHDFTLRNVVPHAKLQDAYFLHKDLTLFRSELWRSPKRRSKNMKIVLPMILISIAFLLCFMPTVIVGM